MQGPFLREYGQDATINFHTFEIDGIDLRKDSAPGVADLFMLLDEAVEVASDNAATDEGRGYSLVIPAVDMSNKRITIYVEDQTGPKAWLDDVIYIETTDHQDAMHPNGVNEAGTAQSGGASVIRLRSGASAVNDLFLGQIVTIIAGTGIGQSRSCSSYDGTLKDLSISGTWATDPDVTSRYRLHSDAVTEITVPSAATNADAVCDELLAGHSIADSLSVHLKDTLADTANMQPKIGTPVTADLVGDIAAVKAVLPTSLTVGGRIKSAIQVVNGRLIIGTGNFPDDVFRDGGAET